MDNSEKEKIYAATKMAADKLYSAGLALGAATIAASNPAAAPLAFGAAGLLLSKYKAMPVNRHIEPVDIVSDTWKGRPKANIVKWLMARSGTGLETVASYLGCTVNDLNNKLTRDSFSFDDLILVAYACGYTFVLVNNNEEIESSDSFRVDLVDFFRDSDEQVLERVSQRAEEELKAKREEYEKKKAELERMKEEYGFED